MKSKGVLKCWGRRLLDAKKRKKKIRKIFVNCGTLIKSVRAVGFSGKPSFLESASFHREIFGVTIFRLDLHICIVNTMIFINKKYW